MTRYLLLVHQSKISHCIIPHQEATEEKNMIISIQKHISKNSAVLHDKSSQQIRNIGKLLQPERPPIIHLQPAS